MREQLEHYINYIATERGFSPRTVAAYRHDLSKFLGFIAEREQAITKESIRDFLSFLAGTGFKKPNSGATRSRKLSSIKSFCKFLAKEGFLDANPALEIEAPKIAQKEPGYLTEEEYECLIAAVKAFATPYYYRRDLAIIRLFLGTGMRLAELAELTTHTVSIKEQNARVCGKGNRERILPFNDEVASVLADYLETRPTVSTSCFFISRKKTALSKGSIYKLIKRYLRLAGIDKEHVAVHSLRHSFGASLLRKGINLVVIQELLGHKSLETTRRYLHINDADLREAVNRLVLSS